MTTIQIITSVLFVISVIGVSLISVIGVILFIEDESE